MSGTNNMNEIARYELENEARQEARCGGNETCKECPRFMDDCDGMEDE